MRLEAVGFEEFGRAGVVCWRQEVAGHEDESRVARHSVLCYLKRMLIIFAYDGDVEKRCYSYSQLMLAIFIAQVYISRIGPVD